MYPEISLYSEGGLALRLVTLVFCSLPYQSVLLRFASLSLHSGYIAQFVPATDTGTVEQDCDVLAALLSAPLYIQFSKNILPMLEAFEVGTHVRLLDVYFAFQQEEENLLPLVVAMTYMSEAFIVKSL